MANRRKKWSKKLSAVELKLSGDIARLELKIEKKTGLDEKIANFDSRLTSLEIKNKN